MEQQMKFAGGVAKKFQNSEITPLLALVGFLLGVFAVAITPQEEEPQISVTFANVFIPFPGATASEVEQLVATPAEQVLSEVEGIKHVYSFSRPGMAVLTVRYRVGEDRTAAILRLYNAIFSNQDWLPRHLGVGQPLVKPKGIDDVPIVTLTLWTEDPTRGADDLARVAHTLEAELKRIPGTRNVYTVGQPERVVHVSLDPQKMAFHALSVDDLKMALNGANVSRQAGSVVSDNRSIPVTAGTFLASAEEVAGLVVGMKDGAPIYLEDVAEVRLEPDHPEKVEWFGTGPAADKKGITAQGTFPAVTLAVAKKPGTNAVQIAADVLERVEWMKGFFIPDGVNVTVTRDYGVTAGAKASKLIGKLTFATASVVLLVLITMGWREAVIVGAAVTLTLALTLFANWAWGFTLNRVSLFALIFSIGILVDDAIVVVENIHRHMKLSDKPLLEIIPRAVDEVGGPTILATFTVIAALLPMAFVTGLMGPYMSPIPINASTGMLISLVVAFVVTPWLSYHGLKGTVGQHGHQGGGGEEASPLLMKLFTALYTPFLEGGRVLVMRVVLAAFMLLLLAGSLALVITKDVVLKMLPFDNKSEFQVVVDMPEGTPVEQTARVMRELGEYIATIPEVTDYQAYAGTPSPVGFNGLVRQYYMRGDPHMGDIQVNLVDNHHRSRKSHEIALAVRAPLQEIGKRHGANVKVVEVPPGPPVQSPLVAEVYGPDFQGQLTVAKAIRQIFETTPDIVDVDDAIEAPAKRYILKVDRERAARMGVSQMAIAETLTAALHGVDASYLHSDKAKYPIPIRLELPVGGKAHLDGLLSMRVKSGMGAMVPMEELVEVIEAPIENAIFHKDLVRVTFVTGDMAGELDSPLYGMFEIMARIPEVKSPDGGKIEQYLVDPPSNPYLYGIKWDGEWQVTYETFRDMGIAYAVGLLMIYLLVVAQFRSYLVPLVIMSPIPLTVIGVLPGHAIMGAQFTATSMIGLIALAGIIVRNSILLVDFINEEVASKGITLAEAVILAGAVRTKPIVLTALAAMIGAFFIIDDPIFSGLAIALIFGLFVSTVLTLWVIPLLYYILMHGRMGQGKVS